VGKIEISTLILDLDSNPILISDLNPLRQIISVQGGSGSGSITLIYGVFGVRHYMRPGYVGQTSSFPRFGGLILGV
jgi:hypothetical protein